MPPPPKRRLKFALVTTLVAIALLVVIWLTPTRVPAAWIKPTRFTALFATESYLVKGSQQINYLQFDVMFEARGDGFESSTFATAGLTDRAYLSDNNDGAITADRVAAINSIRVRFPSLCEDAQYPGMSSRFDELLASGKAGLTIDYPERRIATVLIAGRRYLVYASAATLIVSVPTAALSLYALIKARRAARANCCLRCGYNLAGLTPLSLCPECGLVAGATPARGRWRRGTTRCAAGAAFLLAGIGLGSAWWATATTPNRQALHLGGQTFSSGLEAHSAWLNRGGLHLQKLSALTPAILSSLSTAGPLGGPESPDDPFGSPWPLTSQTPTIPPIDWSLWHYHNESGGYSYATLWISLWPPALITIATGALLVISGWRVRRRAG